MFIAIEGMDGCGKSTIANGVYNALQERELDVILTKEPGGTVLGAAIREMLLTNSSNMTPKAEAYLFAADRIQHLEELIIPSLHEGKIVLCDRYLASSLAYQGAGRDLGFLVVEKINEMGMLNQPDVTIFVDCPLEECLRRLKGTGKTPDRIEAEDMAFKQRVYNGYQMFAETFENVWSVNGMLSPDIIVTQIINIIIKELKQRGEYPSSAFEREEKIC